jgi:tripartite-type tricarboxylate transporter receptor subunit TctC
MMKHASLYAALSLAGVLALAAPASAQTYPDGPIRLIVPFAPGGGADLVARVVAAPLGERLGQQVVVENQPGGGTIIGTQIVAEAEPDGYTLLVGSPSLTINPSLRDDLPFDTLADLVPVGQMVNQPLVVVVNPAVPAETVEELLAYARDNPEEVAVGTPGVGSAGHLATELMNLRAEVQLLHVPYRGTGPAITDLLGGQIDMMYASIQAVRDHIEAGTLRALAVSTIARSTLMPDLPTVAEAGIPGYDAGGWSGILAPAGTPPEVIERLNAELNAVLASDAVRTALLADGAEPASGTSDAFGDFLQADVTKWAEVIEAADIQPE